MYYSRCEWRRYGAYSAWTNCSPGVGCGEDGDWSGRTAAAASLLFVLMMMMMISRIDLSLCLCGTEDRRRRRSKADFDFEVSKSCIIYGSIKYLTRARGGGSLPLPLSQIVASPTQLAARARLGDAFRMQCLGWLGDGCWCWCLGSTCGGSPQNRRISIFRESDSYYPRGLRGGS